VDRHTGPPVVDQRDTRRLFGEELADDELVGPARFRQPGRGGPVDVRDQVAGTVRARARDLVADAAT
jgi:hypothetical protein